MDTPDLNVLDRLRAARAIERHLPNLDMSPPYGEFVITSLGRYMITSRAMTFSDSNEEWSYERSDLMLECFAQTRTEMGLADPAYDDNLELLLTQGNLSLLAGFMVIEAETAE